MRKIISTFLAISAFSVPAYSATTVISHKTEQAPQIDGLDGDLAWKNVKPVAIQDKVSGSTILLKSVYTDDKVYFSVLFPDAAENYLHKPYVWNKEKNSYEQGAHREDTFVFKWSMSGNQIDLSNFSDDNYSADVWYWKANRTNPAGYADDKWHILSGTPAEKSTEITSTSGKKRYLQRKSDSGTPAYGSYKPEKFEGNVVDKYPSAPPNGSRADVKAKGVWDAGMWNIEFERALDTGQSDDVVLKTSNKEGHLFGISIFSLYGRPHDPNSPNYYGRGRISEPLLLKFQ